MMKFATWNINGIRARLENLLLWLKQCQPDIVCLQEIKSLDATFPKDEIEDIGYHVETHGQAGFNGVAILSRTSPDEINLGLGGDDNDHQSRFMEGVFSTRQKPIRIVSLYLPNGNPIDSDKFYYKLAWIKRFQQYARHLLAQEEILLLGGDYNIIPEENDCLDPQYWQDDAVFAPQVRIFFREIKNLGLYDAFRLTCDAGNNYTFWSYRKGDWNKNNGIRIDHFLLSAEAVDILKSVKIEKHVRDWKKPSDHVPLVVELDID